MRLVHPQPIKSIQPGDPLGNRFRNPTGLADDNDYMWPQKTKGYHIVSNKEHGPENWTGAQNKPLRGDWWPVLIDGKWYWDRKPRLGQGIATLLPDHEANQKKETR